MAAVGTDTLSVRQADGLLGMIGAICRAPRIVLDADHQHGATELFSLLIRWSAAPIIFGCEQSPAQPQALPRLSGGSACAGVGFLSAARVPLEEAAS